MSYALKTASNRSADDSSAEVGFWGGSAVVAMANDASGGTLKRTQATLETRPVRPRMETLCSHSHRYKAVRIDGYMRYSKASHANHVDSRQKPGDFVMVSKCAAGVSRRDAASALALLDGHIASPPLPGIYRGAHPLEDPR